MISLYFWYLCSQPLPKAPSTSPNPQWALFLSKQGDGLFDLVDCAYFINQEILFSVLSILETLFRILRITHWLNFAAILQVHHGVPNKWLLHIYKPWQFWHINEGKSVKEEPG